MAKDLSFHPQPVDIMGRKNSTPGQVLVQYQYKGRGYSQIMSKKTELKFGMTTLKTQQFGTDLVKFQANPKPVKTESPKLDLNRSLGRWSLRLPKSNSQKPIFESSRKVKVENLPKSKKFGMDQVPNNKSSVWLNTIEETHLKRSVSDLNEVPKKNNHTERGGTKPQSLLRRSLSDIKQKSNAAKTLLHFRNMKEDKLKHIDNSSVDKAEMDMKDNLEEKENKHQIDIKNNFFQEANTNDRRQFGSILKRPGSKRPNIKHVEFLDNIDHEEDRIRFV